MNAKAVPSNYFEEIYANELDPWGFDTHWYEARRRALLMASLPKARYRRAFEPGCAIGTLSIELASRCDHLVATDVIDKALAEARTRVEHNCDAGTVEFRQWALGQSWPQEQFDLIVLSEVCYYLEASTVEQVLLEVVSHCEPAATVLCAHWRRPVPDYTLTGDEVHDIARATPGLWSLARYIDEDLVLDVFATGQNSPCSVAAEEGIL
ncbi:SAM-dependent methyltransferase [Nocardia altamirensis]|uniref:SAM-dependent methyltransferase n=1 Tax=Nocardia altamirensis TaxID=472158 RepID=UPI00083FF9B2|nr:SAM-dependent methyltransferase [Nocardia altamirensis]